MGLSHLFSISILISVLIVSTKCMQKQQVEFFTSNNCVGTPYKIFDGSTSFTYFNGNTTGPSGSSRVNGAWQIKSCFNLTECTSFTLILPPVFPCYFHNWENNSTIVAERMGDVYQMEKRITLYTEALMLGEKKTFTMDEPNINGVFQSMVYTGNHSWTIYTGLNFVGNSTCLTPDSNATKNGWGITYRIGGVYGLRIGSLKEGCSQPDDKNDNNGGINFTNNFYIIVFLFYIIRLLS